MLGRSCKALFDAAKSVSSGRGLSERRTSIDIQMFNEKMKELHGVWRWTDTYQQLADGLTKLQVRQNFAEKLSRGARALKYDPDFTAGKKIKKGVLDARERELDEAAADGELCLTYDDQSSGEEKENGSPSSAEMAACAAIAVQAGRRAISQRATSSWT